MAPPKPNRQNAPLETEMALPRSKSDEERADTLKLVEQPSVR